MSITDVRELLGTTFAGANQIVQRLVDLKILAEITGGLAIAASARTPMSGSLTRKRARDCGLEPYPAYRDSGALVFNIKSSDYRLVAAIDYCRQIVLIKWVDAHRDYDRIDARTVNYGD